MGEGLLYRAAKPAEAKAVSEVALEWLTANGEVELDIVEVTVAYSNERGYFYEVHYTCDDGCLEGLLNIRNTDGNWIVKEV